MAMKMITVQIEVNAPLEHVWKCWSEPSDIKNWAFASDDWGVGDVMNDLKTGGTFKTHMGAKDGSAGFDFEGTYTEIVPLKRIAYDMIDGRKVTVDFNEEEGITTVTEMFEMEGENSEEMQRAGWQAILGNFKKHAEKSSA